MSEKTFSETPSILNVRVYRDVAGEFRFVGYAGNGKAIVVSSEGYVNAWDAISAAGSVFPLAIINDQTKEEPS